MEHIPKYELILRGPKASFVLGNLTKFACLLFRPVEAALRVTKLTKNRLNVKLPSGISWIVVMGCGYSYKGGFMLKSRCKAAARVFSEHPEASIIASGADRPGHSETGFMKQRLLEYGIPEDRIHCDGRGINTLATFQNCKAMLRNRESSERGGLVVCSNDFHIPRCVYTAQKLGLEAYGTPNPPTPDPAHWRYWLREKVALCKYSYLLRKI